MNTVLSLLCMQGLDLMLICKPFKGFTFSYVIDLFIPSLRSADQLLLSVPRARFRTQGGVLYALHKRSHLVSFISFYLNSIKKKKDFFLLNIESLYMLLCCFSPVWVLKDIFSSYLCICEYSALFLLFFYSYYYPSI